MTKHMNAERWQKPDPHSPGQTLGESVMQQFDFRYGVGQLWLGVGVAVAWNVVMVSASFLCLIFLNREPPPFSGLVPFSNQAHAHLCAGSHASLRPLVWRARTVVGARMAFPGDVNMVAVTPSAQASSATAHHLSPCPGLPADLRSRVLRQAPASARVLMAATSSREAPQRVHDLLWCD